VNNDDILTKQDVAELLQVSERTVERWMSEGSIRTPHFPNAAPGRKLGSFDQKSSSGCGSAPSSRSAPHGVVNAQTA
jgi:excisionase family DNA binding protein